MNLRREVINTRPSFLAKKACNWRSHLLTLLMLVGCVQFGIYLFHLFWLVECWCVRLVWEL